MKTIKKKTEKQNDPVYTDRDVSITLIGVDDKEAGVPYLRLEDGEGSYLGAIEDKDVERLAKQCLIIMQWKYTDNLKESLKAQAADKRREDKARVKK